MNREQLAAMTDDEILAYQRAKRGNPYMPLSMAREMQRYVYRWAHLKNAARGTPSEPCRYRDGTCLTHPAAQTRGDDPT